MLTKPKGPVSNSSQKKDTPKVFNSSRLVLKYVRQIIAWLDDDIVGGRLDAVARGLRVTFATAAGMMLAGIVIALVGRMMAGRMIAGRSAVVRSRRDRS